MRLAPTVRYCKNHMKKLCVLTFLVNALVMIVLFKPKFQVSPEIILKPLSRFVLPAVPVFTNPVVTSSVITSPVTMFDEINFKKHSVNHSIATELCRKTALEPKFTICVHDPHRDRYISSSILKSGKWEGDFSLLLGNLLASAQKLYANVKPILLDCGANLGIHGLYGAALGYDVWAVEPQVENVFHIYKSARLSNLTSRMYFVVNGITNYRQTNVEFTIDAKNNGGSFLGTPKLKNKSKNPVKPVKNVFHRQTQVDAKHKDGTLKTKKPVKPSEVNVVLLQDIMDKIEQTYKSESLTVIVMKMDIELSECRAFLGSPNVLTMRSIKIPFILMEWHFKAPFSKLCSQQEVRNMTSIFVENDYTPFSAVKKNQLDVLKSDTKWSPVDVLWVHKNASIAGYKIQ